MDSESIFIDCALLAVDVCVLSIFHRLCRNESKTLKSVKEASSFKINNDLPKIVESHNGIIPYAVISGNVKALSVPLRSKYFSYIQGVIQERITKEHKVRWNSFLHIWTTSDNNFQHNISSVPFGLCSGNNSLFKKSISVEVIDPLSAEELVLSQIYDDYKVHENSFTESIFGFIWGERTVGIAEVENMLVEGTSLTAVGKIILENGSLKIMPPDNDMTFFLSPLSLETLIRKISARNKLYRKLFLIMCAASASLLFYLSRKWFKVIWRKIDHAKQLKKHEEERRLRRLRDRVAETDNPDEDTNNPKCIICLENPVEILILECGHACLCLDCSGKISDHCPICRTKVQRLVSAFLP